MPKSPRATIKSCTINN